MASQSIEQGRLQAAPRRAIRLVPELLEILDERRVRVMRLGLAFVVVGVLVALAMPNLLAPSLGVGLLVGLAATTLAAAVALGLDALDPVIGGPRHIRASGAAVLSHGRNGAQTAKALSLHLSAAGQRRHFAAISPGATTHAGDQAVVGLATDLAGLERRVMLADLRVASDRPGVAEVVQGNVSLAEAVIFEAGVTLARIGAGPDLAAAHRSYRSFLRSLPSDIDLSFVLLSSATRDPRDEAIQGVDHVLVFAERGVTRRSELDRTVERLQAVGVAAHVVLVEPTRRSRPTTPVAPLVTTREAADALRPPLAAPPQPSAPATLSPATPQVEDRRMAPEPSPGPISPPPLVSQPPLVSRPPVVSPPPIVSHSATANPSPPVVQPPVSLPLPPEPPVSHVDTVQGAGWTGAVAEAELPVVHLDMPAPTGPGYLDEDLEDPDDLDPELIAEALSTGDVEFDDAEDDDPERVAREAARDATTDADPTIRMAPLAPAPPIDPHERDRAIGEAFDDDDDPLAMTAALHSFASERLARHDDDRA